MDQLPRRVFDTFFALSPARKAMLAGLGGASVALALLLYSWSSQTSYVTLYSSLEASDSQRIVDDLRSQGVPFEIEAGGARVLVPQANVDELRMSFAAQGLPEGGKIGFEVFDGNAFTATDFVQRLNFQRGLQGELARSIETFSSVEHARVHIVLPERSLFVSEEQPTTASVVLQLRPGRALGADQVSGIAHLVSGAVEGLSKQNLTIVDTGGSVLYDGAEAAGAGVGLSSTQMQLQQSYEQRIEHDVQKLLDRTLGLGRAAVQVRATLNFDTLQTEKEEFTPAAAGQGFPRSSTQVEETYTTNGDAGTGTAPGALANVPGANAGLVETGAAGAAATEYNRTETTSNFELGRTVTKTQQAPGGVQRLSVSLLLDESIPEAQATSLQAAVEAAVGMDAQRGDRVVVSRLAFDKTATEAAMEAFASEASSDRLLGWVRLGLPIVVLLLAFFLFRSLLRAVGGPRVAAYDAGFGNDQAGLALASIGAATQALPQRRPTPALAAPEPSARSEIELQVQGMAQTRPDSVAEVVQAWLREE